MLVTVHRNCSPGSKIFCKTSVFPSKAGAYGERGKLCLFGHLSEEINSWEMEGTELKRSYSCSLFPGFSELSLFK